MNASVNTRHPSAYKIVLHGIAYRRNESISPMPFTAPYTHPACWPAGWWVGTGERQNALQCNGAFPTYT